MGRGSTLMRSTFAMLLVLTGCRAGLEEATIVLAGQALTVELARTPEQQRVGLMNRRSLDERRGMLFVYDADRRMTFWMKNTTIPLSIAFLSRDGTILQIEDMEPLSLVPIRSVRSARYALEVNQGLFDRLGVAVGDQVQLPEGLD